MSDRELRKLAERATPGPWEAKLEEREHTPGCLPIEEWVVSAGEPVPEHLRQIIKWGNHGSREDAEYIAAANPAVVLSLLDRIDELEVALRASNAIN